MTPSEALVARRAAIAGIEKASLVAGGTEAIRTSADPLIILALAIDGAARGVRKRFEDEVTSVERSSSAKIARAVFATEGSKAC